MPRYRVSIEFDIDRRSLTGNESSELLDAMQVQLESLEDGDIADTLKVSNVRGMVRALPTEET